MEEIAGKLEIMLYSLQGIGPELVLMLAFLVLVIADLIFKNHRHWLIPALSLLSLVIAIVFVADQIRFIEQGPLFLFDGLLFMNGFEAIFKILFIAAALLTILFTLISSYSSEKPGEYYAIIVAMTAGLSLLVMSSNLLMVYLSLEFVSVSSYILAVFTMERKGGEAGLKYVLFGIFSSALMLFGMSYLYGFTGTLNFTDPAFSSGLEEGNLLLFTASLLTLSGFLFKVAAVPFHTWAPDIYESAPYPVAALFSTAPKAAGFAVLFKLFYYLEADEKFVLLIVVIALVTLFLGNLGALFQIRARRLLGYSSIAHSGFLLCAIPAVSELSESSVIFYLIILLFMNFAAFLLVEILSARAGSEDIGQFKGIGKRYPYLGILAIVIMVALTGLPPTAGFYAKFFVFSALWEAYQNSGQTVMLFLLLAALGNTLLALFYYLKIPYYMFFKNEENTPLILTSANRRSDIFVSLVAIPLIVFFFRPDWLMNWIKALLY